MVEWFGDYGLRAIIAIGSLLTSGGVIALYRINRDSKAKLLELEQTADDRLNTHYAAELSSLREQLKRSGDNAQARADAAEERYTRAMMAAEERFNIAMTAAAEREQACEDRVRELRDEVRLLSEEIVGLRKNVGQTGRSAIVLASQVPSLPIQEAADRAATALTDHDERLHDLPHESIPE